MPRKSIRYYQLIPLISRELLSRQIIKARMFGAAVLLDLEESMQRVVSPVDGAEWRVRARHILEEIAGLIQEGAFPGTHIYIKVNAADSEELQADLAVLQRLRVLWAGVFLPRVDSPEILGSYHRQLRAARVKYRELIPIIETGAGVANLEATLAGCPIEVSQAFFGNYDYHLDTNTFPVAEQHEEAYWELITPIVETMESYGIEFGNSPYTRLKDDQRFVGILERLNELCTRPFGQITLRLNQSRLCRQVSESPNPTAAPVSVRQPLPAEEADYIIKAYEAALLESASDIESDERVITAQEYLLARAQQSRQ